MKDPIDKPNLRVGYIALLLFVSLFIFNRVDLDGPTRDRPELSQTEDRSSESRSLVQEAHDPKKILSLKNDIRIGSGLRPLNSNSLLIQAAKNKLQHMEDNDYFAHVAPDGTQPWRFIEAAGYIYAHAGENLAEGYNSETELVQEWMESETHRRNILSSTYTDIGIASNGNYVVAMYATLK